MCGRRKRVGKRWLGWLGERSWIERGFPETMIEGVCYVEKRSQCLGAKLVDSINGWARTKHTKRVLLDYNRQ